MKKVNKKMYLFCFSILLFSGCVRTEIKYVEVPREPIVCHRYIKSPLDIAKCLEEYKIKWSNTNERI